MNQPNPWILCMGGFALLQVAAMVYGAKGPEWLRTVAALVVGALGLICVVLAFKRQFGKKPAPPPRPARRAEPRADKPAGSAGPR
jgi:purine-cytosine permease-like protein